MLVPSVEGGLGGADGFGEWQLWTCCGRRDDGQSGSHRAVVEPGVKDGGAQALGGDPIAARSRDALDETMKAQPTQVVGDLSGAVLAGLLSQQWSEVLAQILVGECALDEKEEEQHVQESLNAGIGEAQRRRPLVVNDDGPLHVLEGSFADEAVVSDALDVEQTSVGCKADLAQILEILDASADGEVAGVVDRGFGSKCLSLLVILLDAGLLVIDVTARRRR